MFVLLALLLSTLSLQQPAAPTVVPTDVAAQVNPVKPTAASQAFAKKMYGYDCAMCHGANGNGKGDLAVEQKLSLKDYTDPAALKDMSDGELFSIIKNGVRFTGMPAWGSESPESDRDSWKLVHFIRHLPKITKAELSGMEVMNPVSPMELKERDEEARFLEGKPEPPSARRPSAGHQH